MSFPSFQDFLNDMADCEDAVLYDARRFSYGQLKTPGNPFPEEEYSMIVDTCVAMVFTFLAQYHQWLIDQLCKRGILNER